MRQISGFGFWHVEHRRGRPPGPEVRRPQDPRTAAPGTRHRPLMPVVPALVAARPGWAGVWRGRALAFWGLGFTACFGGAALCRGAGRACRVSSDALRAGLRRAGAGERSSSGGGGRLRQPGEGQSRPGVRPCGARIRRLLAVRRSGGEGELGGRGWGGVDGDASAAECAGPLRPMRLFGVTAQTAMRHASTA